MKPKLDETLRVDVTTEEGSAVMTVNGRVTIDSSPVLRDRLLGILRQERLASLTIDLTAVPYVDSSGLATLLEALKLARAERTSLQLRLHERPLYLLKVTGLLPLFDASPDAAASDISQEDV